MLGIFRSLGALSRAITPLLAGAIYWSIGARSLYAASAALVLAALGLVATLPKPARD